MCRLRGHPLEQSVPLFLDGIDVSDPVKRREAMEEPLT